MCGILAIFEIAAGADLGALRRQALELSRASAIAGRTGAGCIVDAAAILVHERLAIVDPASGAQPLRSRDGALVLAVNGEIYNHRELARGQWLRLPTGSDCEVINALYREHGQRLRRQAQRHLRVRAVGRRGAALPDRARSDRRVPAVLGPRRARPPVRGLGDEGAGRRRAPTWRRSRRAMSTTAPAASLRSLLRQAWRDYEAIARPRRGAPAAARGASSRPCIAS